jgi:uracil-DNA glycosylase family 4
MLIGEAPGYWESQERRPFTGKSGRELDAFLSRVHLYRETIYVTNLCKQQPPFINGKQQPPTQEDIRRDTPELIAELAAVRPRWIGAIGRYATRFLTGLDLSMESSHGLCYSLSGAIGNQLRTSVSGGRRSDDGNRRDDADAAAGRGKPATFLRASGTGTASSVHRFQRRGMDVPGGANSGGKSGSSVHAQPEDEMPLRLSAARIQIDAGDEDQAAWIDDCIVVPLYHPAAGIHNPELSPLVFWDIAQFAKYATGRLPPLSPCDEHHRPHYERIIDFSSTSGSGPQHLVDHGAEAVTGLLRHTPLIAIDTEGYPHDPFSIQFSAHPGTGYVVRADAARAIAALRRQLFTGTAMLIGHNWLGVDLDICRALGIDLDDLGVRGWDRVEDTMLMLFCLRLHPLGLKPISRRLLGATQRDYAEVIAPAERRLALAYIKRAIAARACPACEGTGKVPTYSKLSRQQLARLVVRRSSPHDVYIGRPSKWGNPFKIGQDGTRDEVIQKFRTYLYADQVLREQCREELNGKVLACHCAPLACHGAVLAEIANGKLLKSSSKCTARGCIDGGLWPARQQQLDYDWDTGRWKFKTGWQVGRYLRSLQKDIEAGKFDDLGEDADEPSAEDEGDERKPRTIRQRWNNWDEDIRGPVEELLGPMPQPTLRDVPAKEADDYAARDADLTLRIYPRIRALIDEAELYPAYRLDMNVIPVAAEMQRNGMPVDIPKLQALTERLRSENDIILAKLHHLARRAINPASGDQVAALLFGEQQLVYDDDDARDFQPVSFDLVSEKRTKTGKRASTDDKVLEGVKLKYSAQPDVVEVVQLILDYRMRHKIITTYTEKIPGSRERSGWRSCFAAPAQNSGRGLRSGGRTTPASSPASGRRPQQPSVGRAGTPSTSRTSPSATRAERISAAPSAAALLRRRAAFSAQRTIRKSSCASSPPSPATTTCCVRSARGWTYTSSAPPVLGECRTRSWPSAAPPATPKPKTSATAQRNLNFGIVFGITPRGLQAQMELRGLRYTLDDCEQLIRTWVGEIFPGIGEFIRDTHTQARREGLSRTPLGHIRYAPAVWSTTPSIREEALRQLVNFRIQGGAAEALKAGLRDLWRRGRPQLDSADVLMLMSVHDENIFQLPDTDEAREVTAAVVETYMCNPIPLPNGVQITTKVKFARDWGALK